MILMIKGSTNRRSVERLYVKKDIMLTERLSRGIGFQVLQRRNDCYCRLQKAQYRPYKKEVFPMPYVTRIPPNGT